MSLQHGRIKVIDRGFDAFILQLKELDRTPITIGVHSDVGADTYIESGNTVAEVAYRNEMGDPARHVPERSFLRSTAENKKRAWKKEARRLMKTTRKKHFNSKKFLEDMGEVAKKDVKKTIWSMRTPSNDPRYVKRVKPHVGNNPLINTLKLWRAIDFKIRGIL